MITNNCPTRGRVDLPLCRTCRYWRGHAYAPNWGYCVRPFDGGSSVITKDWEGCPNHALREEAAGHELPSEDGSL